MTIVVPALPDGAIELRAEVEADVLRFAWRGEGIDVWQELPQTLDYSILSDEASLPGLPNFTGTFVGVACQDVAGTATPADFAFFRYEGRDPD
jgi:xylan 1,4-beta-xylosidase